MNINPLKTIYKFNQEAGLLAKGYSDERECAFPIEEALEDLDTYKLEVNLTGHFRGLTPKDISRLIVADTASTNAAGLTITDADRLDKHLDIIVYSLGSIYKLGLTPQQVMRALGVVAEKNMEKLKAGQDSHGKQQKPEGFIGPEAQLEKILNER